MNLRSSLLIVLAGLVVAPVLSAQTVPPRDVVARIGEAIQSTYYDADRARIIVADLDRDAAAGLFDQHTDPRELATALTARLKPLDAHFSVDWTPVGATTSRPPGPAGQQERPRTAADSGIHRVEILPANLGLIEMRMFAGFSFEDDAAPARRAIEAALQLVSETDAVIIDLRQNGGGSPAMVGYLSSAFTPRGADIYNTFHFRDETISEAPLQWYPQPRLEVPLYVLISGRTGSAAEAFAYTMKNAGRATIVGEASAGAANPGGTIDAGNGFSIFVSNGSPVSPITHANWEGAGVQPDIAADAGDALHVAQIHALTTLIERDGDHAGTAAQWALQALQMPETQRSIEPLSPYVGQYGVIRVDTWDNALIMRNGRRPARALVPIGDGLFTVAGDPNQRIQFERTADQGVIAFDALWADGSSARYRRN